MGKDILIGVLILALSVVLWRSSRSLNWIDDVPAAQTSSFYKSRMMDEIDGLRKTMWKKYGKDGIQPELKIKVDFPDDFQDFTYIRSVLMAPDNHALSGFHAVLANNKALASGWDVLDEGAIIIKLQSPSLKDPGGNLFQDRLQSLMVIEKDSKRFPAETEGLGFEIFDFYNGTRFVSSPEQQMWCFKCHKELAKPNRIFTPLHGGLRALRVPRFRNGGLDFATTGRPGVEGLRSLPRGGPLEHELP